MARIPRPRVGVTVDGEDYTFATWKERAAFMEGWMSAVMTNDPHESMQDFYLNHGVELWETAEGEDHQYGESE